MMDHRNGLVGVVPSLRQQAMQEQAKNTALLSGQSREISPVEEEMNRLHASLDRCAAMVDELGRRLGAVRDPGPTAVGTNAATPDTATRGALCATIRQASYKADSAADELRRFLDELTV